MKVLYATLACTALIVFGQCQNITYNTTLPESLVPLPQCAADCYAAAIVNETNSCIAADEACYCNNVEYIETARYCVLNNCTVADVLGSENITATACGRPVRSRSAEYLATTTILGAIAIVTVIVRIGFTYSVKRELGPDDWLILACAIIGPPSTIALAYLTTQNGLGKDIWTVSIERLKKCGMYFFISGFFYYTAMALLKLSFLFFYLKLFQWSRVRILIWGTIVFVVLWGLAFNITLITQCYPVSFFWQGFTGDLEGHCVNINAIGWCHAAINLALDFWMLAIPLSQLRGLRLSWKKKIGVAVMFCVGSFVTIVSIIRLHSLVIYGKAAVNPTWDYIDLGIWTYVELDIGIICACLPTLRLILVHIFPKQLGSTPRHDTSRSSAQRLAKGVDRPTPAKNTESSSGTQQGSRAITLQRAYTVEYSDNDEAVLMGRFSSSSKPPNAYS